MTLDELGNLGEFIAAIATLITLGYLAIQIRQNTAQQRREELISIQHGQNGVLALLQDPGLAEAYVRTAGGRDVSPGQRLRAQNWILQYLNHFQIVHDLHQSGALDEEQYRLWEGFAVAVVAPVGIRQWWEEEDGRLAFHSEVREIIDARLQDEANPPLPVTKMWSSFDVDAWEQAEREGPDETDR